MGLEKKNIYMYLKHFLEEQTRSLVIALIKKRGDFSCLPVSQPGRQEEEDTVVSPRQEGRFCCSVASNSWQAALKCRVPLGVVPAEESHLHETAPTPGRLHPVTDEGLLKSRLSCPKQLQPGEVIPLSELPLRWPRLPSQLNSSVCPVLLFSLLPFHGC